MCHSNILPKVNIRYSFCNGLGGVNDLSISILSLSFSKLCGSKLIKLINQVLETRKHEINWRPSVLAVQRDHDFSVSFSLQKHSKNFRIMEVFLINSLQWTQLSSPHHLKLPSQCLLQSYLDSDTHTHTASELYFVQKHFSGHLSFHCNCLRRSSDIIWILTSHLALLQYLEYYLLHSSWSLSLSLSLSLKFGLQMFNKYR